MDFFFRISSQWVHYWYIDWLLLFVCSFYYLLEVFIRSKSPLVESFGTFKCRIILPVNRNTLASSFHGCIPSFFSLIALVKTSTSILNESDEMATSLHSWFYGNGFQFPSFSIMLALCVSHMDFLCWYMFLLFPVCAILWSWGILNFVRGLLYIYWGDHIILSLL